MSDGTSHPSFWSFIDKVAIAQVSFIEFYVRQDVNDNIEVTLAYDIVLRDVGQYGEECLCYPHIP
ncbi:hypothetical protein [Xenorhabdus sp. NBAII XenSa04]|uniref:hypothetical protein n=1 Tax=Xenorhabdus sp. NBAII XenSa04 TaxID=1429873 RepID=UPI000B2634F7|nr:hypothetical protein [Xenorhabdus sp. NBAII XenSa04]